MEINTGKVLRDAAVVLSIPLTASVLLHFFDLGAYDPVYSLLVLFRWHESYVYFVLFAGFCVWIADAWRLSKEAEYRDSLYEIIRDIGDRVALGAPIETAVTDASRGVRTGPARHFREALHEAEQLPFEVALRQAGRTSARPEFEEMAELLAAALEEGGRDAGKSIRWLGSHFGRIRKNEREFTSKVTTGTTMLRFVALVAAPPLYTMLSRSVGGVEGLAGSEQLYQPAVMFYLGGAVLCASTELLMYGRLGSTLARLPFFIGVVGYMLDQL